jgi:bifunctional non-homologous end joining protein LigD
MRTTAKARTLKKPRVEFTHLDKVMFPEKGFSKGDLLAYYEKIAPKLLPHLRDRPITLERLPDGLKSPKSPHFWQKNTPEHYPGWIPRIPLPTGDGDTVNYAVVNDLDTLLYLVNQGTTTFHVWFSRVKSLDRPDFVLFDLDPSEATFKEAVAVAKRLREIFDERKVPSFPKTSGKSGLHVLVPWKDKGGYDEARAWAMEIAEQVVSDLPEIATVERSKSQRKGRLYLDVMQNVRGHHAVPPYVIRATPGATVSTPLDWKEVNGRLDPERFDINSAPTRFAKQRKDPMAVLGRS